MTTFKLFARKCFGVRGERLVRCLVICAVVYGGLSMAVWRLTIAQSVLCLMAGVFSGGVMLRALIAVDNMAELRHLLMLPCAERAIVQGYVGVMAVYTLLTKTLPLLAVLLAVSVWSWSTVVVVLACALNGVLLAALFTGMQRVRWLIVLWGVVLIALLFIEAGDDALLPWLVVSMAGAVILLRRISVYALWRSSWDAPTRKRATHGLMLHYFLRYLLAHKNYLVNTVALWGMAAVLPFFLQEFARDFFVAPLGFAILTLNTPLGILFSADSALERAVRALPGGVRCFCLPYAALLFNMNLIADGIFLVSWQCVIEAVDGRMLLAGICIAAQSALASVWLEWRHPLRNWRIESDLWHHPRKYLVPGLMLLLAVLIGSWSPILWAFDALLVVECGVAVWYAFYRT